MTFPGILKKEIHNTIFVFLLYFSVLFVYYYYYLVFSNLFTELLHVYADLQ